MGKNTTPQSFGYKTLNFHQIFKCHTILKTWGKALIGSEFHLIENSMTKEKLAPENWQKNSNFLVKPWTNNCFGQKSLFFLIPTCSWVWAIFLVLEHTNKNNKNLKKIKTLEACKSTFKTYFTLKFLLIQKLQPLFDFGQSN